MGEDFEKFIKLVSEYNPDGVETISKAYAFAKYYHEGQMRESGEPYIIHPLAVAMTLAEMQADSDTICAGLLHDVLEDCKEKGATKELIEKEFNPKVAELVDGVTNLTKADFESKEEAAQANKDKIINGLAKDPRIIIIKLADRLHNINTLQYRTPEKQKKKAKETLEFYSRLARYIGAEKIRRTLEDMSFKFLHPKEYEETERRIRDYYQEHRFVIGGMVAKIRSKLKEGKIPFKIRFRVKNIYSVYVALSKGESLENLHDLFAIKILTSNELDCYKAQYWAHTACVPMNRHMRDYINNAKPNMYRSLHSVIFGPKSIIVQLQIRTTEMEEINTNGLAAFWKLAAKNPEKSMQSSLSSKYGYVQAKENLTGVFNDALFAQTIQQNAIDETISIYDESGHMIEIPKGATLIDFAYSRGEEVGKRLLGGFINGQQVDRTTTICMDDHVTLLLSEYEQGPNEDWLSSATTVAAQRMIRLNLGKRE